MLNQEVIRGSGVPPLALLRSVVLSGHVPSTSEFTSRRNYPSPIPRHTKRRRIRVSSDRNLSSKIVSFLSDRRSKGCKNKKDNWIMSITQPFRLKSWYVRLCKVNCVVFFDSTHMAMPSCHVCWCSSTLTRFAYDLANACSQDRGLLKTAEEQPKSLDTRPEFYNVLSVWQS